MEVLQKVTPKNLKRPGTSKTHSPQQSLFTMRLKRWWASLTAHLIAFSSAYAIAFLLRFDFSLGKPEQAILLWTLPWVLALKLVLFYALGSFQARWRFVTLADLTRLALAATAALLVIFAVDYFLIPQFQIPRSVILIDWGLTILSLGGVRSASRIILEHLWPFATTQGKHPVLVIGADSGGEALVREVHTHPKLNYHVVGFLDDNLWYRGSSLSGTPFLGTPEDALEVANKHQVKEIVVITGSLCGKRLRMLLDDCQTAGIKVKMVPPLGKLLSESYKLQVRDVDINDLLRRNPIQLDTASIAQMLQGRTVLVTGAGGSIGSEICRQVLQHEPGQLLMVERAENSMFQIEQELLHSAHGVSLKPCIADISDVPRLKAIYEAFRPEVVFHAAAHKHVPLMECNVGEAVKNNIFGTRAIASLSEAYHVERFIMISTDKAVNPTSVMGLSKRLAERCIYALAQEASTKFVVVRFGNVLGSNGSVVPTFQEQIRRGGPVTITHREMRRFFMTIPEASQLVLQAATLGEGGEVFVLDMGEQVKIIDLANDLIRLSGFNDGEIDLEVVGIRPGEKLYEEICEESENSRPTSHPKVRVIYPQPVNAEMLEHHLEELKPLVNAHESLIRKKLLEIVLEDSSLALAHATLAAGDGYQFCSNSMNNKPAVPTTVLAKAHHPR